MEAAQLHREAAQDTERHDAGLAPPDDVGDTRDDLIERISRSRARQLAHTFNPDLETVDRLARRHSRAELESLYAAATTAERIATTEAHGLHSLPRTRDNIGRFVDALDALMQGNSQVDSFIDRIHWL